MSLSKPISLRDTVQSGKLHHFLRRYLESCRPPIDGKPSEGKFPNYAGFCRWLGCGISEVEALKQINPAAYDYLHAVMEDEALNHSALLSPTVTSAYLKRRMGYGEKPELLSEAECGEVRVVFEHDIGEDGA